MSKIIFNKLVMIKLKIKIKIKQMIKIKQQMKLKSMYRTQSMYSLAWVIMKNHLTTKDAYYRRLKKQNESESK